MATQTASTSSSGISFSGLLTIAFIVLKLTHVISWSWIWVLAPLWISLSLWVVFILLLFLVAALK